MNVRYKESASGGKVYWLFELGLLGSLAVATGAASFYFISGPRWYEPPAILCASVLPFMLLFRHVSVEVCDDGISAWLGPIFPKNFERSDIKSVEVERYNWREFGGWGWRRNSKGDRTFSAPGIADCIRIKLNNGKSFVVTLNNPAACKAAFDRA